MFDLEKLEQIIGYGFQNRRLLHQALTHSSVSGSTSANYERLEFLGDRVLGLAVAEMLYRSFPAEPEGSLSQRHTALVCKETVASVVRGLEIDKFLFVASEDIRENENVLCDVGEAVIGAVYIDGGAETALNFVRTHWQSLIHKNITPPRDGKTWLQEESLARHLGMPVYNVVSREGSEHEPVFHVSVSLSGTEPQTGQGRNKKMAEQDAAHKMLIALGCIHG